MPIYSLRFNDQPGDLLERLEPALASQGDPAIYVVEAADAVQFTGGGRASSCSGRAS